MIDYLSLPTSAGVYLYKNKRDEIIYVGKAKNLKRRVSSYFTKNDQSPKTILLVKNITDLNYYLVNNEVEALLLENKLIKKYKPKYNIRLKDSKTYAYIKLTDETYPRIHTTRRVTKKGTYFGPFTDGTARYELQKVASAVFKLRTCKSMPKRACLNYHIGLCSGPCIGAVSASEYSKQVASAKKFISGKHGPVLLRVKEDMQEASSHERFEIAMEKRNQIVAIKRLDDKQAVDLDKNYDQHVIVMREFEEQVHFLAMRVERGVIGGKEEYHFDREDDLSEAFLTSYYRLKTPPQEVLVNFKVSSSMSEYLSRLRGSKVVVHEPVRGDKKALIGLALKNIQNEKNDALVTLQDKLNLPSYPRVIECFDISNLKNTGIVAGMTQWVNGLPNKEGYRKFDLDQKMQDDFLAMKTAVFRRYKRLRDEEQSYPDLILIDGGLGQLSSATAALKELGLQIPIISLAKQREEIFTPDLHNYDSNSPMMLLLRSIRDSVHNFVITYQRSKRKL